MTPDASPWGYGLPTAKCSCHFLIRHVPESLSLVSKVLGEDLGLYVYNTACLIFSGCFPGLALPSTSHDMMPPLDEHCQEAWQQVKETRLWEAHTARTHWVSPFLGTKHFLDSVLCTTGKAPHWEQLHNVQGGYWHTCLKMWYLSEWDFCL